MAQGLINGAGACGANMTPSITFGGTNYSGTSGAIEFGKATKVYYTSVSGGGNSEYSCSVTLQGSNDNSSWVNDKTYSSGSWGNTSYTSGESNNEYKYWRIKHNVTKSGNYSRTTTTIGSIDAYEFDLKA